MKTRPLLANGLLLLFLSLPLYSLWAQSYEYKRYGNARFGYCALYPEGLLFPQREAENGDGLSMRSADQEIEMTVYGSHNVYSKGDTASLMELYGEEAFDISKGKDKKRLTFHRTRKDHYIVSGYKKDRIYYQKVVTRGRVIFTLYFEYPAEAKEKMDAIVTKISHAFPGCNAE